MCVNIYTVRLIINILGVEDYGIFSVVAGVVSMFGFLTNTMATASQRFFSFELGKNNIEKLRVTFSVTIIIYALLALIVIVLAETIGLWFLNTKLTIPSDRLEAGRWVYQFAIALFVVSIMSIPYNSAIIAKENMKVFAYVSIIEVVFKLLNVYLLSFFDFDKLKLYAVLLFISTFITQLAYFLYCRNTYSEFKFKFIWDKTIFKKLLQFCGWNLFGGVASVANNYGVNILLNLFFTPVVNAARAIAYQIYTVVNQFVSSFIMATNPQITKYFAENNLVEMHKLVFRSSKFSFFLLSIITFPIIFEMPFLLRLWLEDVPMHSVMFTRLILILALIESLSYPLMTSAQATGKIKVYQSVVGSILLLNLPISFVFLKLNFQPEITLYVSIFIAILSLFARLLILRTLVHLSFKIYMNDVFIRIIFVVIGSTIIPISLVYLINNVIFSFFIVSIVAVLSTLISIYLFGFTIEERFFFKNKVYSFITKSVH
jgi:O-antigen/teichoic acid export membrane protein